MEYKVGDWVVRLNDPHLGIQVGQVCQIYEMDFRQPRLQGQNVRNGSHSPDNLRMAYPEEIPGYVVQQEDCSYLAEFLNKLNIN